MQGIRNPFGNQRIHHMHKQKPLKILFVDFPAYLFRQYVYPQGIHDGCRTNLPNTMKTDSGAP